MDHSTLTFTLIYLGRISEQIVERDIMQWCEQPAASYKDTTASCFEPIGRSIACQHNPEQIGWRGIVYGVDKVLHSAVLMAWYWPRF
jgi:hypothetical protein